MRKSRIGLGVLSLVFLLTLCESGRAQAVYGSISGTVTDPSGAVVSGAKVTITSVDRKTADTVTTNDSGNFVKDRLVPGNYDLKVESQGFKATVIPSVVVNL